MSSQGSTAARDSTRTTTQYGLIWPGVWRALPFVGCGSDFNHRFALRLHKSRKERTKERKKERKGCIPRKELHFKWHRKQRCKN